MTESFIHTTNSLLHIEKWQNLNTRLRAGFTTRQGGLSQDPYKSFNLGLHVDDDKNIVIKNRQRLAQKLEIPLDNWVAGEQIHSTEVVEINQHDLGKGAISYQDSLQKIDGMITNEAGMLCTAFFADCVPLFFFDPVTNYIGIAHAGWKGSVQRIAGKMVDKLQATGVDIANLLVAIGPCISQQVYEVDEHVTRHIPEKICEKVTINQENGHYLLDLKQLNVEILLQCGVIRHNIDVTNYCTFRDESLFFSHRRDNGETGRMLGYIGYST
ncbi:peptidoglycan editing factor PgeF [Lentibacillus sp. Marseille-P4043]|uniref:peptidoglycan editing factor PgeF n=1 Tax=Lentibacillus sp. Marseille-P4043 TaxID=2040293 RepID=UPI000D0B7D3F|nr:peptidoglycan editing factor PgeF [Lentibacillus sp. Marseille-P4043]